MRGAITSWGDLPAPPSTQRPSALVRRWQPAQHVKEFVPEKALVLGDGRLVLRRRFAAGGGYWSTRRWLARRDWGLEVNGAFRAEPSAASGELALVYILGDATGAVGADRMGRRDLALPEAHRARGQGAWQLAHGHLPAAPCGRARPRVLRPARGECMVRDRLGSIATVAADVPSEVGAAPAILYAGRRVETRLGRDGTGHALRRLV